MKITTISLLVTCLLVTVLAAKPKKNSYQERFSAQVEQTADSEERLDKWYRDAKYGAFIHFGVYSMLGGEYEGKVPKGHYSEWIRRDLRLSPKAYHKVASQFNPTEFDAKEWVSIFKNAGMKYVVITSKHHDGFCLFDTKVSSFDIIDHAPFKRDIIKELNEACHAEGLKFGVYYSHAKDWDEPDAADQNLKVTKSLHPGLPKGFKPDLDAYFDKKSLPQVEELMKNYEIDIVWFDTPHGMTPARAKRFSDLVRKHRPDCLINSRIMLKANDVVTQESLKYFDFGSLRDKEVPPIPPHPGAVYVESPDSVSSSYGYKNKGNHHYHSEKEIVERLVYTVCNGGNYLLNNGPTGLGKIDPKAVEIYKVLGDWLKVNGESIYNTRPNPTGKRPAWGDISASKDGKTLYLHVLKWPEEKRIDLQELKSKVHSAVYLANGEKVDYNQEGNQLKISLPAEPLNKYDTVLKLSLN